jgi:hypothetical protein
MDTIGASKVMRSTDEVSTVLPDLRAVSLTEMSDAANLDKLVQRAMPGSMVPSAQVLHAFQSSI